MASYLSGVVTALEEDFATIACPDDRQFSVPRHELRSQGIGLGAHVRFIGIPTSEGPHYAHDVQPLHRSGSGDMRTNPQRQHFDASKEQEDEEIEDASHLMQDMEQAAAKQPRRAAHAKEGPAEGLPHTTDGNVRTNPQRQHFDASKEQEDEEIEDASHLMQDMEQAAAQQGEGRTPAQSTGPAASSKSVESEVGPAPGILPTPTEYEAARGAANQALFTAMDTVARLARDAALQEEAVVTESLVQVTEEDPRGTSIAFHEERITTAEGGPVLQEVEAREGTAHLIIEASAPAGPTLPASLTSTVAQAVVGASSALGKDPAVFEAADLQASRELTDRVFVEALATGDEGVAEALVEPVAEVVSDAMKTAVAAVRRDPAVLQASIREEVHMAGSRSVNPAEVEDAIADLAIDATATLQPTGEVTAQATAEADEALARFHERRTSAAPADATRAHRQAKMEA